jgi:hypothetical protein
LNAPDLYARIEALSEIWWREINLSDLDWFAHRLANELEVTLPDEFPTREQGVELVELVEERLLAQSPQHVVRLNAPPALVQHCKDLTQELRARKLLRHDDRTNLVAALFAWLGCIGMAKTLREVDSQGQLYSDDIRRRDYATIERQWGAKGGAWVRYGVTVARKLERERIERGGTHRDLIDNWVPRDSPYWDES